MELQFPDALLPDLIARFKKYEARLLPSEGTLRQLLALAFYASLGQEEGRNVRFALMLTDEGALRSRSSNCWAPIRFSGRRPATVREIVKLAPATDPVQTFIALVETGERLEVAGLIRTNRDQTRIGRLESQTARYVDMKYVRVTATGPGSFTFGLQHHDLLRFADGTALPDPVPALHMVGGPLFAALDALTGGPTRPANQPPLDAYTRVLLHAARDTAARAHGGAIVLTPREPAAGIVELKYKTSTSTFHESVSGYATSERGLRDADGHAFGSHATSDDRASAFAKARLAALQLAQQAPYFGDAASALGDLTSVDGVVLLGPHFSLLGFGGFFRNVRSSIPAQLALDPAAEKNVDFDLSTLGSRHRSVASFCHDQPGAIGIVVSQDGDTSCFVRPDKQSDLIVWRPVALEWTIPTMAPPTWSAATAGGADVKQAAGRWHDLPARFARLVAARIPRWRG